MATQGNEIMTRISLKFDSYENWQNSELVLLPGEMAICEIPGETKKLSDGTIVQTSPTVLFKVGSKDKKAFKDLPWASAKAADVYAWAKAENVELDTKSETLKFFDGNDKENPVKTVDLSHFASDSDLEALAAEVDGLSDRVDAIDTDTKYVFTVLDNGDLKIQATDKNGTNTGEAQIIPIISSDELNTILAGYVTTSSYATDKAELEGAIADVDGKFVNYTTTADMNVEFAKYTKTENLDSTIAGLQYIKAGAVDTKISTALTNHYTKGEIDTKVNGINDLIDAINENFTNYDTKDEVDTKISDALEDYYDKEEVDGLIADLATAMNFIGVVDQLPAKANDGDVVVLRTDKGTEEYVWYNKDWQLLGDESLLGQVSSDLDVAEGKIADLEGIVESHNTSLAEHLAAIQANAKAITDNEADIEKKHSDLSEIVSGHTQTLAEHLEAINKNADDISALPSSITISSEEVAGEYVSAISGNGKDGFTISKSTLPTLTTTTITPNALTNPGDALAVNVLTAISDNGTAGHTVKLVTDSVSVATTKGAEKAALDAVNTFAANIAVEGEGTVIVGMTKDEDNNITLNRGYVNVDDLVQTENTYVVFNCGSTTINI